MQDRIAAERWIRSTYDADRERSIRAAMQDDDPDLGEKVAAYDASVEWVARGYYRPAHIVRGGRGMAPHAAQPAVRLRRNVARALHPTLSRRPQRGQMRRADDLHGLRLRFRLRRNAYPEV